MGQETEAIEAALRAMSSAALEDNGAIEADLAFHRAILAAAHNPLLLQMGNLIGIGLLTSYRISNEPYTAMLETHAGIYEAIRDRDPQQAQQKMHLLLQSTRSFYATQECNGMATDRKA